MALDSERIKKRAASLAAKGVFIGTPNKRVLPKAV
jgi:hypothetical protein